MHAAADRDLFTSRSSSSLTESLVITVPCSAVAVVPGDAVSFAPVVFGVADRLHAYQTEGVPSAVIWHDWIGGSVYVEH